MKIFPTSSIATIDSDTIRWEPIASIDLMERAAACFTNELLLNYTATDITFAIFAGRGNNGGDALAVARMLLQKGRKVAVWLCSPVDKLSPDCKINLARLEEISPVNEFLNENIDILLPNKSVIIDGLFGSGLNRPLEGFYAKVVEKINSLGKEVVAIDIPSGLMGENNIDVTSQKIICASRTFTFQFPKLSMFFAENAKYVGEVSIIDISLDKNAIKDTPTDWYYTERSCVESVILPRNKHAHKGCFGRVLLIAGSKGMAGASVLATRGALRSGVGLLTVHVPQCNNIIVQSSVPEAMTSIDISENCFSEIPCLENYNAIAVGPGIGRSKESVGALMQLLEKCNVPLVIDADALNIISANPEMLDMLPKGSVITPHPGEFARLAGKSDNGYIQFRRACDMARSYGIYVVLKGAYTAIFTPDGECHFNSTGNPGMATGGSGDVLTGVLAALLGQGYRTIDAIRLGVYIHGLAGDIAAKSKGETAMTAGDIIDSLSQAWLSFEK